ncbi:MAG: peptidyl-prolyl cis-trans isomerase C [Candidatus Latescibacterota bacterium]
MYERKEDNNARGEIKLSSTAIVKKASAFAACVLATVISATAEPQPEYVARVVDKKISVEEFQQRAQEMMKTGFRHVDIMDKQAKKTFIDGIIAHELLVLEGLRRGLDRDSTIAEEVQRTQEQALRQKLYEVEALKGDYSSTEDGLKLFFKEQQYDTEVFTQHIVCDSEQKALEVLDRLDKGETFEELFPLYSTPHIQNRFGPAGWVGWIKIGGLLKPLIEPVNSLAPGETYAQPVETGSGYHVFKLKVSRPVDFAKEQDWVGRRLLETKRGADMETYVKDLRRRYGLTLHAEALSGLQALAPGAKEWPGEDQALFSWRGGQLTAGDYMAHHLLARVKHPAALDSAALHKAADGLAGREIMLTEALKLQLGLDPEIIGKMNERRDKLLVQWLYHLVGKAAVRERIVAEEEIRGFYDVNLDMFTHKDGTVANFDLVHDSILTSLHTHIENKAMDGLIAQLRDEYKGGVEIYPEILAHTVLTRPKRPQSSGGQSQ